MRPGGLEFRVNPIQGVEDTVCNITRLGWVSVNCPKIQKRQYA